MEHIQTLESTCTFSLYNWGLILLKGHQQKEFSFLSQLFGKNNNWPSTQIRLNKEYSVAQSS